MVIRSVREIQTVSRRFRISLGDPTEALHRGIALQLARFLGPTRAPDEIRDQGDDCAMCLCANRPV